MAEVHLEIIDSTAIVTVDSPDSRNALTPSMGDALVDICDEIDGNLSLGATIIRGANGTFCSGGDRRDWDPFADQSEDSVYKKSGRMYAAFLRVGSLATPTIAAVRGAAVGGGMNLMMATDLRVVAEDARIFGGFQRIGMHPGGGFFTLAGRLAGRETAAATGLFDCGMDGRRAVEVGLAWVAVADHLVDDTALELATTAATDPALARESVRSFRQELGPPGVPWAVALEFERATQMWAQRRRKQR